MEIKVWKASYARDCYLPLFSHPALGKELWVPSGQWTQVKNKNISLLFLQLEMANETQAKINGWEF